MKSLITFGLFVLLVSLSSGYQSTGGIQGSISIPSISNIMTLFPISLNVALNKKTIELNITDKGTGYELDLNSIYIASISGPSPSSIKYLDGTNSTVRIELGGLSTVLKVNGSISVLNLLTATLDTVTLSGLTIIVDVDIIPIDEQRVIYNLSVVPNITIQNLDFNTTSRLVNKEIEENHDKIMTMVGEILTKVEAKIESLVSVLNTMIANRDDKTFLVDLLSKENMLFNLTSTTIPTYSPESNLFNFTVDGLFFDNLQQETHIHSNFNAINLIAQREPHIYSEQTWIHQSLINSLILGMFQGQIEANITNPNITKMLEMFIPEFSQYYGKDVNLSLNAKIIDSSETTLKLSKEKGILIGDGQDQKVTITIYATNDKVVNELAAQFELYLFFNANVSMNNFMVYVQIPSFTISGTNLTINNCKLYDRDYNDFFNDFLGMITDMVNDRFVNGIDLAQRYQILGFLKNMFTEITLTPFMYDENFFFGFKYMLDGSNQLWLELASEFAQQALTF